MAARQRFESLFRFLFPGPMFGEEITLPVPLDRDGFAEDSFAIVAAHVFHNIVFEGVLIEHPRINGCFTPGDHCFGKGLLVHDEAPV